MLMRLSAAILAILFAPPDIACAETVADTLKTWGLLGTWSADCDFPAGRRNGYYSFIPKAGGQGAHDRDFGDIKDSNEILSAEIGADNSLTLRVRFQSNAQVREFSYVKGERGVIRAMTNREAGGAFTVRD
ncbi:MAG: hypothetical protein HY659_10270, partial [Rhizobiales bacterium]|nr:hypothetical protein [Hyphomicrobiales bacterium]